MQHCNDSLNDTSSTPTSFFSPVLSESERLNLLQSVSTTVNNRRMRSGRPPSSSSSSSSSSCKETTTSLVLMDDNAVAKSANANNNDVGSKENAAIEINQRGINSSDRNKDDKIHSLIEDDTRSPTPKQPRTLQKDEHQPVLKRAKKDGDSGASAASTQKEGVTNDVRKVFPKDTRFTKEFYIMEEGEKEGENVPCDGTVIPNGIRRADHTK